MRPDQRTSAVVGVGIATVLAAGLLNFTAWSPSQDDAGGNQAAATEQPLSAAKGVAPTSFYDPPAKLPAEQPGAVLKSESITGAPAGVKAWRLLYLSRTKAGDPIAISALYLEPDRLPETGDRFPLVGFAHGTTGIGRECGLSQAPFTDETPGNEYWRTLLAPMVGAGYAVVATDYEGMGAPGTHTYLLRKQSYDVLDSLRAALQFRPQFLDSQSLAVLGHSEGGYVALTTADMAKEYAPELAIRGSVSMAPGGVPPLPFAANALLSQTGGGEATPRSGYVADLTASWNANYPQYSTPQDWYTALGLVDVPKAYDLCQGAQLQALNQGFGAYYNSSVPGRVTTVAALEQPLFNRTPIPILIQQGAQDSSVVPQISRAMAIQGCALGDDVTYQQYPDDVHRSVQYTARTQYLTWLQERFDAVPEDNGCRGWQG